MTSNDELTIEYKPVRLSIPKPVFRTDYCLISPAIPIKTVPIPKEILDELLGRRIDQKLDV